MASKASGNTRAVTPTKQAIAKSRSEYSEEMKKGLYDETLSKFDIESGGYLFYYKGRKFDKDEYDAAMIATNGGYQMIVTPEGGAEFILSAYKGKNKYGDGKVAMFSYEQSTPAPKGKSSEELDKAIDGAVNHAKVKGASVALIYDKNGTFHRENVKAGIERYMEFNKKSKHQSVKWVLMIDGIGKKPYEWQI